MYANPRHRGTRQAWAPRVATGTVRCARGAACSRAELVDGVLVGGFTRPGERWHLAIRTARRWSTRLSMSAVTPGRRRGCGRPGREPRGLAVSCGGSTVAIEWGAEPPVLAVICDAAGDPAGFRFFSVVWSDAPPSRRHEEAGVEGSSLSCAGCLVDAHPEIGRGLDVALEHGCAVRDPLTSRWASEGRLPLRRAARRAREARPGGVSLSRRSTRLRLVAERQGFTAVGGCGRRCYRDRLAAQVALADVAQRGRGTARRRRCGASVSVGALRPRGRMRTWLVTPSPSRCARPHRACSRR